MQHAASLVSAAFVLVAATGCGGSNSATAPSGHRFGLIGSVSDAAGHPLPQARVEVLNGSQNGRFVLTDDDGSFEFGPIFDAPFSLRASRAGRRGQVKLIQNALSDRFFMLNLDFSGTYDVTFTADAACTALPAAVRTRTYSASVGATGETSYLVTLQGGDFGEGDFNIYAGYRWWNVLYAAVAGETVHLFFSDPEIWEHVSREADQPQTDLTIYGDVEGPFQPDASRWLFSGRFTYCPAVEPDEYPECRVPEITCESRKHELSLTRR